MNARAVVVLVALVAAGCSSSSSSEPAAGEPCGTSKDCPPAAPCCRVVPPAWTEHVCAEPDPKVAACE